MKYMNISDKYGNEVEATIEDYRELNPDGNFEERYDGIYENGEMVAEVIESESETAYEIISDKPV